MLWHLSCLGKVEGCILFLSFSISLMQIIIIISTDTLCCSLFCYGSMCFCCMYAPYHGKQTLVLILKLHCQIPAQLCVTPFASENPNVSTEALGP